MSVSNAWTNSTPASTARNNRTGVITDTGTNLNALDKTKHKIVTCSSTGSGYTINHAYLFLEDGSDKVDLMSINAHTHSGTSDGGEMFNIYNTNYQFCNLWLTKSVDLLKANWNQTVTSTGTIEDATDGTTGERSIRLRPNGTSGASATINYPHLKLDFSKRCLFQGKYRIETATSLAFHTGINCDDITAADSNTVKLQAEICTVTNSNWWLRTASGSANTASDTGIAISTSRVGIRIKHFPDVTESQLQVGTGTLLQKTTNIPVSGATADNNLVKNSIKNSTPADRPIHYYGSRLAYTISDEWR